MIQQDCYLALIQLCRLVAETSALTVSERPVEVEGGADQGQMRKRLWEIA